MAFKGFCYLRQMQSNSFYLPSTLCILILSPNIFANWVLLSLTYRQVIGVCDGKTSTLNKLCVILHLSTYLTLPTLKYQSSYRCGQQGELFTPCVTYCPRTRIAQVPELVQSLFPVSAVLGINRPSL